jgi:hypothetical protein
MAWQIRATATAESSSSSSSVAVTIPATTQSGDFILQFVTVIAASVSQTPPAGWSSIATLTASTTSSSLRGAYRTAQVGDANTLATFSLNNSSRWATTLIVVYNDAGGVPRIEQLAQMFSSAQTTSPPTPTITPQNNDDLLLAVFGGGPQGNGTQSILSANPSYTLQTQISSASGTLKNAHLAIASQILASNAPVPQAAHGATISIAPVGASVLISSHNVGPVANAGTDQTVDPGAVVTLNGSDSSDFDGTIVTYAWVQLSGTSVTLSNSAVVSPTFTAPSSVEGAVIVFGLTVTDNEGAISPQDTVTITVGGTAYEHVWNGTAMVKQQRRSWVGGTWVA